MQSKRQEKSVRFANSITDAAVEISKNLDMSPLGVEFCKTFILIAVHSYKFAGLSDEWFDEIVEQIRGMGYN